MRANATRHTIGEARRRSARQSMRREGRLSAPQETRDASWHTAVCQPDTASVVVGTGPTNLTVIVPIVAVLAQVAPVLTQIVCVTPRVMRVAAAFTCVTPQFLRVALRL